MKFLFFDEVSMDLSDARQWYKEQKEGLEEEFSEEIKKALLKSDDILSAIQLDIEI